MARGFTYTLLLLLASLCAASAFLPSHSHSFTLAQSGLKAACTAPPRGRHLTAGRLYMQEQDEVSKFTQKQRYSHVARRYLWCGV
eukprot:2385656-Rhodomonas_salina.2